MSLSRLRSDPAELEKLLRELTSPPPGSSPEGEPFSFKPRALFSQPGFLRGLELLRLGRGTEAKREFRAVGITVPDS